MDVKELVAGREVDTLVAEKVMGLSVKELEATGEWEYGNHRYSTDISAAWQLVEILKQQSHCFELKWYDKHCFAWIGKSGDIPQYMDHYTGMAGTAPLAICRAALKLMEVNHG